MSLIAIRCDMCKEVYEGNEVRWYGKRKLCSVCKQERDRRRARNRLKGGGKQ